MKKHAALLKSLWNDESGQGATEYILLLVVVVALATMFRQRIMETITNKMSDLSSKIGAFGNDQ